ncbi:methyltransferase [Allostreptomyces psammosilenae]|uniref:O-methyltransferase n=1 Tax=Allostreptomyces psammosilenae TaxID=1892865 RepID=A0A852ZZA2_9ACTN|nr:methyltransferase [Allostreptomyces psammosilenae]NYI06024.1 hypothetical protein [Allostreptomyces psammosilenae]
MATSATSGPTSPAPDTLLFRWFMDAGVSQVMQVAATLRLADRIASGVTRVADLARDAGADADALRRVLRFLACRGVFREVEPDTFAMTTAAEPLLDDHPSRFRRSQDLTGCAARQDRAYMELLQAVRTGRATYPAVFGRTLWEDLTAEPELLDSFDAEMAIHHSPFVGPLAEHASWASARRVVDVGGGSGRILARILDHHPHLSGALVDTGPTTAIAVRTLEPLRALGRCEIIEHDFFDGVPVSGDVFLLSNVVHNWSDDDVVRVLRLCTDAMEDNGRVLIVESLTDQADPESVTQMDLWMLVLFAGRQRSYDEITALAARADLQAVGATPLGGEYTAIALQR